MKKIIFSGLVGLLAVAPLAANLALAQNIAQLRIDTVGPTSVSGVVDIVRVIVRWVYVIFFILTVFFLLLAAFNYLTAGGDQEKVSKAKSMIIYAAVAVVIAFLSVGFETIIGTFLTTGK